LPCSVFPQNLQINGILKIWAKIRCGSYQNEIFHDVHVGWQFLICSLKDFAFPFFKFELNIRYFVIILCWNTTVNGILMSYLW
jgi:hypothetical protein